MITILEYMEWIFSLFYVEEEVEFAKGNIKK
jgi:hypothetical protein